MGPAASFLVTACVTLTACSAVAPFACTRDEQCSDAAGRGSCEPAGYCAFDDASCASGKRFASYAGDALGDTCVSTTPAGGAAGAAGAGAAGNAGGGDEGGGGGTPPLNLVINGGCETGTSGWAPYNATIAQHTPAHSGAEACELCATHQASYSARTSPAVTDMAVKGEVYEAQAWVRAARGSLVAWLSFAEEGQDQGDSSKAMPVDATAWVRLSWTHEVTTAGTLRLLLVRGSNEVSAGECLLFDDVVVFKH